MDSAESPWARIRRGDRSALAGAFDEHGATLRRLIAASLNPRLRGRVDTDDILQEAFVQASQRCKYFDGDGPQSLYIWLRLIVIQTTADAHRRHLAARKRNAARECQPSTGTQTSGSRQTPAIIDSSDSPEQLIERLELAAQLRNALAGLGATDRQVLRLRHFAGLTNFEVASALGIKPKAASIRYVRALGRLKMAIVAPRAH